MVGEHLTFSAKTGCIQYILDSAMARKSGKKTKGQKIPVPALKHIAQRYLDQNSDQSLSARQMIKRLKVANDKKSMEKALNALVKEGKALTDGNVYRSAKPGSVTTKPRGEQRRYQGKVDMTRSGDAYIICDDLSEDVYVRASDLASAMNGDIVQIVMTGRRRGRLSGTVDSVVKRAQELFLGTFSSFKKYNIVSPEHRGTDFDIVVRQGNEGEAKDGDTVVVAITRWRDGNKSPEGEVRHVLGAPGSGELAMKSLLIENGFDIAFPDDVLEEARKLPEFLTEEDLKGREDFREVTTFTIDPETAKDFDDALSVRVLENGHIEVGVHIADVTHFVREGTAIDKEAYERSTSVYLVDRVAPMLPEELSNALCSLRPHEESACFSAVFTFDKSYQIVDRRFVKTVIYSDHRFAYEDAQKVLETGEGPFAEEVKLLDTIAHKLRADKIRNGALTFETDEVQFVLDDEGVPVEIYAKERKEAHLLIEDFMLLANKEVARYIGETRRLDNIPFVYRIHDHPDPQKLAELALFAKMLGFPMRIDTPSQVAKSLNSLAKAAQDNEALAVLEPLAIRTMAKAEYNTENIGHYGLAFTFYTHFTSPIRRYSDVLVHRILHANLDSTPNRMNATALQDMCKHISEMERKAQKAERESIKYKQAEYLSRYIGEEFTGHISGMIDKGIFVKLDANHAEGLVQFARLDEPYDVRSSGMIAQGRFSGDTLRLGDEVRVVIIDADPSVRQVDMGLISVNQD